MKRFTPSLNNPWFVTALYVVMTIGATWPLARVMSHEVAGDLGDPLFNCWIMMWTGGQMLRFLKGDWSALGDYWNGNIFYPEQLTIAYSEHLTPQMLQILPVYALTGNMVLCYNLLFLSAITLCGLGMYLLVRELTDQPIAAFVAGVAFALSPYRVDQFAHLQVMSSQWMPLALYGFRRYFTTGRPRALVGAAAAVVVQVLSCFYYLFFFAPFAAAYCLYEIGAQHLWRSRRVWMQLAIATAVSLVVIAPFLTPYVKVRQVAGIGVRSIAEISTFSADTWALATASENLTFWGTRLRPFVRPEGQAFPGFAILALGLVGAGVVIGRALARSRPAAVAPTSLIVKSVGILLLVTGLGLLGAWGVLFVKGPIVLDLTNVRVSLRNPGLLAMRSMCVVAGALVFPRVRRFLTGVPRSAAGFMLVGWLLATMLAFGPEIRAHGRIIGPGPYALLYHYIPGFNGMRVPSRFMMVATLFLTCLGGIGLAEIAVRWKRVAYIVAAVAISAIVFESAITPFVSNKQLWVEHFELEPKHIGTGNDMSTVYGRVRDLPLGTVLAEFPFGTPEFDIQSTYYAGFHRKPLVNGFSGFFPESFRERAGPLGYDPTDSMDSWKTLIDSGATHVIVHEGAYHEEKGAAISAWLRSAGAKEILADGSDRLFALK